MKKTSKILIVLSLFLLTACSSGGKDLLPENENKGSGLVINEITDQDLLMDLQELIEAFYFNPIVNEETGHEFFIDKEQMLSFAAYYKNNFSPEKSIQDVAYDLFGLKSETDLPDNLEFFTGYWTSQDKNHLPLLEGVYQNENYLIAKAVVYSIIEGTSSERQSAATITMTFEKDPEEEGFIIIDYKYDKNSDLDE